MRMVGASDEEIDHMFAKALLQNHANCLYVYDYDDGKIWHTKILNHLLLEDYGVIRENIVTVASFGFISEPEEAEQRLKQAKDLTNLENIDLVIVEVIEISISSVVMS